MRIILVLLIIAASACPARAQDAGDRQSVRQAALDYVNALYDVQPELIERSVHPELSKTGNWNDQLGDMSYEQLVRLAGTWNADNRQGITDETVKGVEILDMLDRTAVVKLSAQWGVDYMLVTKTDGEWKTLKILWQPYPRSGPSDG